MKIKFPYICLVALLVLVGCARMGNPDGGWFDEDPPRVVGASPADKATGVNAKKVRIEFDEFIKLDNASENVIVSPPQIEMPEIKASGKTIEVKLIEDRKSTRLNSSHANISYAVFCLKKKHI